MTLHTQTVDRRAALKKAAIAAGAVAWATPTIQALTPGVASAQVRVTNCRPVINWSLAATGGPTPGGGGSDGCVCFPGAFVSTCCEVVNNTHHLTSVIVGCGASCPGTPTFTAVPVLSGVGVSAATPVATCQPLGIWRLVPCTGTKSVTYTATVRCPDNVVYTYTETKTITCGTCVAALGLAAAASDEFVVAGETLPEEPVTPGAVGADPTAADATTTTGSAPTAVDPSSTTTSSTTSTTTSSTTSSTTTSTTTTIPPDGVAGP